MTETKKKVLAIAISVPFAVAVILMFGGLCIALPYSVQVYADLAGPPGMFVVLFVFQMFHKKLFNDV